MRDRLGLIKEERAMLTAAVQSKPLPKRLFATSIIQRTVAKDFNLTVDQMLEEKRTPHLVECRRMSMFLCHKILGTPATHLAFRHGGRDTTTALHALECAESLYEKDVSFARRFEKLRQTCIEALAEPQ